MMIITILIENLGDQKHWLVFLALLYVLLITSTDCAKLIIIGLLRHFSWTQYLDISTGCWLQVTTCFLATLNTSWGELPIFGVFVASETLVSLDSRVQTIS